RQVLADLVVIVVLIARDSAHRRPDPQPLADRFEGSPHARIGSLQRPEGDQAEEARVDGRVEKVALAVPRTGAGEPAVALVVKVAPQPFTHVRRRALVLPRGAVLPERLREAPRRVQPADDRRDGERMHAPAPLPQVLRGPWQARPRLPIADQE